MTARLTELYPGALVMLKLDSEGSYVHEHGEGQAVPPATNNLVDATGAGDSFAGAFLAHHLRHGDALAAARFATKISAWVIEHLGARPAADARLTKVLRELT